MINKSNKILLFLFCLLILSSCSSIKKTPNIQSVPSNQPAVETEEVLLTETAVQENRVPLSNKEQTSTPEITNDLENMLAEYNLIHLSFLEAIKTTNWIQRISTDTSFSERTQTYTNWGVSEEWYRFDENGELVEFYIWLTSTPEDTPEQEACLYKGRNYNVTMGSFGRSEVKTKDIDFTGGFLELFQNGENQKHEQVEFQGVDAEKFSFEMQDGPLKVVRAIYFDSETNYILGKEGWWKEADGSWKLASQWVITSFVVDAEPPLEHFQAIYDQVPK